MTFLNNSEAPVMVKMANGETIMGKMVESLCSEKSPFNTACMLLEDVGTFQTGRHPKKQGEILYSLIQWQIEETYIPWDKVLAFGVASEIAQEYYRQMFQRVQVADVTQSSALERGPPGEAQVIHTP